MDSTQRMVAGGLVASVAAAVLVFVLRMGGDDAPPPVPVPAPPAIPPRPAEPTPGPAKAKAPDAVPVHEFTPSHGEVPLPEVALSLPGPRKGAPHAIPLSDDLRKVREHLAKAVHDHGRDPNNPWALTHTMLALGPEVTLPNGVSAVDHLFATYAEPVDVGADGPSGRVGVAFPASRGDIRIEPHTDLVLKAVVEGGLAPDRKVTVAGEEAQVLDLYRTSMHGAWVEPRAIGPGFNTGFDSMNDSPWSLQGLSSWAPAGYGWTAIGGHEMTMDAFTEAALVELETASAALMSAKERGVMPQKDGKGILAYTCGGQHLIQGVAHAVARGFGPTDAKARMCAQRDLLRWRIDHELGTIDPILVQRSDDTALATLLLDQRMKFLGHAMETLGKIDAYGYCDFTEVDRAAWERLGVELARTVLTLDGIGVYRDLEAVRHDKRLDPYRPTSGGAEQVYLDLLGDSAHAIRGIDMVTGTGTIAF